MGPRRSVLLLSALLCALALCCAAPALALEPAGDGWYWQLPQPQGHILNAVAMSDAADVWAVGYGGTILHSTDGGSAWAAQSSPTVDPLAAVAFADDLHGCAVGGRGFESYITARPPFATSVIVRTEDGGVTWQEADSPLNHPLSAVTFLDASSGWAVGKHGTILHTSDGGVTWTAQRSGVTAPLWAVVFADAHRGWAAGGEGLLLTTADGGLSWRRIRGAGEFFWGECGALALDGAGTLWAAMGTQSMSGEFDRLWRSVDGGHHWRRVDLGWDYNVWSVTAAGSRIVAVGPTDTSRSGATSRVVVSDDGGQTWQRRVLGEGVELRGVAVGGALALCAVGGGTFTSDDGGSTWTGTGLPAHGGGSLDFVSPTQGWATGGGGIDAVIDSLVGGSADGTVLHTDDGVRWREQLTDPGRSLLSVDFADAQHGWAVGEDGAIWSTTNGGATWAEQDSGVRAALLQVQALDASYAWALGMRWTMRDAVPALLCTTDGGSQWRQVTLPASFYPFSMSCPSPQDVWLAGVGKKGLTLRHSTDAGGTWVTSPVPEQTLPMFPMSMDFTDPQHGWVVAEPDGAGSSLLLKTTDGGNTWTETGSGVFTGADYLSAVDFVDAAQGWVGGDRIFVTSDGGATWAQQVAGLEGVGALAAVDQTHAWAGVGTGILSTVDAQGDTAPPTTLSQGPRGWLRTGTRIALKAADTGGSGVASTEYSVDGGAWQPYVTPIDFLAPSDHSGDGVRRISYRSTDLGGLTESLQSCVLRIDTIHPVCRLRPSVVGRDNVLRLRARIDDASAPYVDEFMLTLSRGGRSLYQGSWEGYRWPTGKWRTVRSRDFTYVKMSRGWYKIRLYAVDPAGNKQGVVGESRLLMKYRGGHVFPMGVSSPVVRQMQAPELRSGVRGLPAEIRSALERFAERFAR